MANSPRTRGRRSRQGSPWVAVVGYGGLGLGCLLLAAATFIILAAPVDLVRDRLVHDVKSRTGRDLVVSGPTSLVLFPRLAVTFGDVSLSPPPGMGGEPTLKVRTLEAEVAFLSLLSQQVAIKRLVLSQPVVELRIDAQGRRSWEFATAPKRERWAQASRNDAQPPPRDGRSGEQLAATLAKLTPISVKVVDGTVRYVDERAGARHDAKSLDLALAFNEAAGPLEAKGNFVWQGEKLAFEAALAPLRSLLQEQRARVTLKLTGGPINVNYDGALSVASGLAFDGNVSLKAPSAQTLGSWLGRPMPAGRDPGSLSLTSAVSGGNGQLVLSRFTGTIGDTSLNGALTVDTSGVRPRLSGNLQVSELDFARMLVHPGKPAGSPPAAKRLADPIEEILRDKEAPAKTPQVRGFSKRNGGGFDWSDDIVDFGPLGLADADVALSADRIIHKDLKIGPSRLSLKLDNKIAKVTLEDMQLYGGRGRGVLTLDGSGQVPVLGLNLALDGVSARPLLKDAVGFEWLEGRGTITLALAGQGMSERQMIETLNGKIDLATANGTIHGFDVDKLLHNVEQGRFSGLGISPAEKTPFSEFAGSYVITNGVALNKDLRLVSPRLTVTGQGSIDLPQRQLDYTVNPRIAGGLSAPGAVINVKNIEIPVRIEGSWDKPNFSVKGQEQILEAVKQIGKNIKSKDVNEALKSLFGGGDGQNTKPRDLLEKFLKKQ